MVIRNDTQELIAGPNGAIYSAWATGSKWLS